MKGVWTEKEIDIARWLFDRKAHPKEFIKTLGRTKQCCYAKLYRTPRPKVAPHVADSRPKFIPDAVLEDAIKRSSLPRTITAILFGDPPPGYSALDRRA